MRIKSVKIKNYHSIVECDFKFPDLLALVGKNNSGKSNILYALNLFLSKEKPSGIYSFNDPQQPIEIILEFGDLTDYEKTQITEEHRDGNQFILKKIYIYDASNDSIEKDFTSVKNGNDTNKKPRGFENVLSDVLPELYLLPAIKYPSEETKLTKTTNFGKFIDLIFEKFEADFSNWKTILGNLEQEAGRVDDQAPLVKISSELSQAMKEQFSDSTVVLKPDTPNWRDVLKSLAVLIDDDIELPLLNKGQGTQRAFIFALLRVLAKTMNERRPSKGKEKKDIIIAIEEPELYLHPQQQKVVYSLLKELSRQAQEQVQIIYTTHSSFMVHIEDYQSVGMTRKPSITVGTKLFQYTQEIFSPDSKEEFQLLCQFDPERNELFFAEKVIFVEGDTEKFSLPVILDKLGINPINKGVSIIECGSKSGIKLFVEVANKFNGREKVIDYLVMYDKDIPWKEEDDPKKLQKEEQAAQINKVLKTLCDGYPSYEFDPDFERELLLDLGNDGKPYKARKALVGFVPGQISARLKDFLQNNL